ncbi:zinc finger, CCHC-type containing protein [Tanacetum coccineum]|uniref:Zinc finger, CCHC-type containing protein n=1 Tax=Tanacetum coccineum TaxID=301880 RepID=A0ABQ5E3D9_9ASTR
MHFLLTTLKVVYVLTTLMPELIEVDTVEAIRRKVKWENDDYMCRGHILNGMSDSLFDIYHKVESTKKLWDSLELKYIAEDASSKKFLKDFTHTLKHGKDDLSLVQLGNHLRIAESLRVQDSNKGNGKEVARPSVNMTEEGAFYVLVDAIAWWIDSCATTHVFKDCHWIKAYEPVKDETILYMGDDHFAPFHEKGSVCGYKQVYESNKYILSKSGVFVEFGYYNNGMFMLNLNKVLDNSGSVYMSSSTVVNFSLWHARLGHVNSKRMLEMSKDNLIPRIDENHGKCTTFRGGEYYDPIFFQSVGIIHETIAPCTPQLNVVAEWKNKALKKMVNFMLSYSSLSEGFWGEAMVVVRLSDPKKKTLGEKGIDCIFVGYVEHSKAYRFYVIEPNDSISINSIIESRDEIFDENRFSSIARPKDIIPNSDESQTDDHSNDLRDQEIKLDHNTLTAIVLRKILDSVRENVVGCKPLGYKWIFKRMMKVNGTIEKFKARLVIQGFTQKEEIDYFDTYAPLARITAIRLLLALVAIHNLVMHQMDVKIAFLNGDLDKEVYMKQSDCSLRSTPMDPVEKIKTNTSKPVDQLKYSRVIGCLMYAMTSTRPDISYAVVLEDYSDASWINHVDDSSSTSGWVFLLRGCAISWASKKKTCITGSTMEYEFVALAADGKEAEWLRNLIHEIPIWSKLIAPISIHCDSTATLAKEYNQIYNGKSRHLRELKTLFAQQVEQELLQNVREFHACKQEEGKSVSSYVLKMKSYIDNLECLGHLVSLNLAVSLILVSLKKEYDSFVQKYNMHGMEKMGKQSREKEKPLEAELSQYLSELLKNKKLSQGASTSGVVRFGKKGKLAPRFVGPFEIIEKVGLVAYQLDLLEELNGVHDMFHVSNLKKCLADPTLQVPLDEIQVDAKLNFVEEPVEILERVQEA